MVAKTKMLPCPCIPAGWKVLHVYYHHRDDWQCVSCNSCKVEDVEETCDSPYYCDLSSDCFGCDYAGSQLVYREVPRVRIKIGI